MSVSCTHAAKIMAVFLKFCITMRLFKTNHNTVFLNTTADIIIWTNCWTDIQRHMTISDNAFK